MRAILTTLCGCHRVVEVENPPPRQYPVRYMHNIPVAACLSTEVSEAVAHRTRVFRLKAWDPDMAVYVEEWER